VRIVAQRWIYRGLLLCIASATPLAQQATNPQSALSSDAVASRFVAAHGQRALLMGYSGLGLEAWAYPFQLFRNYRVQFLPQGNDAAIDGDTVLRRIEYRPDEIVRTYVGVDFTVSEYLFVPLDQPGVILTYIVEGRPVDIRATFLPVLNLMWPAGVGGQDLTWNPSLHGYVISERSTGFRATIASPQVTAHSQVVNSTLRQDLAQSMVIHPVEGHAQIFAALTELSTPEGSGVQALERGESQFHKASKEHVAATVASGLEIHTPDAELNQALLWSKLALDQAWVCNDRIGCGIVAGYGPSRGMRRPQYAWFFGGDGLVATRALLAVGENERARAELEFILKYQNRTNGMIWHEISQSAGFLDWAGKYPYLYVHVDISFDFLTTLASYYSETGDATFLREHWPQIAAAYAYCRSTVNAKTALPEIPAGKEGGNEQDRMSEDVGLSAAWTEAAAAFEKLATATGHANDAEQAAKASEAARKAIAARYWDAKNNFWIAGFAENGTAMTDQRSHSELLGQGFFTTAQEDAALDRLASTDFQTDWGTRSMSARSPGYSPDLYGSGSVWALGTEQMTEAFWQSHRPQTAAPIWKSLLPWFQLDSLGHMHEVLAGNLFHPEVESVPEQTWSSAGFLHAAVHGLFGLEVDAPEHRILLAPHLDPHWGEVSLQRIAVGAAEVAAKIDQKPQQIDITLSATGGAVHVSFAPEIALGAVLVRASLDGRNSPVTVEKHNQDEHARVELDVPAGGSVHCSVTYSGGVQVAVPVRRPAIGDPSEGLKLTGMHLDGKRLTLNADVLSPEEASIDVRTPWKIETVQGGSATPLNGDWTRLTFSDVAATGTPRYAHRTMTLELQTP
jgi:glycogen debranching enzyme